MVALHCGISSAVLHRSLCMNISDLSWGCMHVRIHACFYGCICTGHTRDAQRQFSPTLISLCHISHPLQHRRLHSPSIPHIDRLMCTTHLRAPMVTHHCIQQRATCPRRFRCCSRPKQMWTGSSVVLASEWPRC